MTQGSNEWLLDTCLPHGRYDGIDAIHVPANDPQLDELRKDERRISAYPFLNPREPLNTEGQQRIKDLVRR